LTHTTRKLLVTVTSALTKTFPGSTSQPQGGNNGGQRRAISPRTEGGRQISTFGEDNGRSNEDIQNPGNM